MTQAPPPSLPQLAQLRGVSKFYENGVEALRDVDLDVRAEEFLALLGPSGCGKSTILRLIAGLEAPSAGTLTRSFAAGSVGFVFQEPTLMPWAKVFDNVFLPLRLAGQSRGKAAAAVEQALALVGLEAFQNAFPNELSGGMKMRVSIARALAPRPSLILMDEPFAALDEITRFQLNDDLLRLRHETGATIVFVTHSIFEAAYLSTRIAVMSPRPGRIVAEIDAEAPRGAENFRSSPAFAALCEAASNALHRAMGEEAS
ncbi:ABC transporter related [Methylocella silvestris BL2]|uniref:ABC transporter related n=1 Tax=Methylocella silvestris (strain DSM 15510 / CIP 108128 / LMG 27833 / NCIMB 13906 / BL2) TaxID=395965 RepID=B8ENK1_METSB|nr:ABC transporter ATP-binding protein [Methylocella silvestris]ACK50132.1 ABC transporter related [Methylocella silvestris BL2]